MSESLADKMLERQPQDEEGIPTKREGHQQILQYISRKAIPSENSRKILKKSALVLEK